MPARSHQKLLRNSKSHYRMPAEWEPHEATWIAWPHNQEDWPGKFEPIAWVYAEIVRNLSRHERVEIIVNDAPAGKPARKSLERANAFNGNVRFHRCPTDRVWTRDSGCTFVKSGGGDATANTSQPSLARPDSRGSMSLRDSLVAMCWRFNAWAKYSNWRKDQKVAGFMGGIAGASELEPAFGKKRVVLEGGSIDVNGQGTLLTTEECLLGKTQQRNPGMKRSDYERVFAQYLGITNVVWLKSGIAGDDTHGHVDDITRFVTPDTVVSVIESDPNDVNYEPLRENIRRLRAASDQNGHELAIIELPMPRPIFFENRRLPASYANFYIANAIVLVPMFNDPADRIALDALADVFPDREVVGIYCGDLIWGFGAIHCMTQQQPAT
ncbi:MAG TPA: agmatine deiminase family protein [Terriglobales bacterium]|nr:agmatine deiminase family protein [Terriglobales bacterium]